MTAQGSVELAVRAVEEGATDFIAKPFEVKPWRLVAPLPFCGFGAADTGTIFLLS